MNVFPTTCIFMIRDLCRQLARVANPSAPLVGQVVHTLDDLLAEPDDRFVEAMRSANHLAWDALEQDLAVPANWPGIDAAKCRAELIAARTAGLLDAGKVLPAQIRGYASRPEQYQEADALDRANAQTLELLGKAIKAKLPDLSRLVLQEAQKGESYLVLASQVFFARTLNADAVLLARSGLPAFTTDASLPTRATAAPKKTPARTDANVPRGAEAPSPEPGVTSAASSASLARVEQLLATLTQRFNVADLEHCLALLGQLREMNDPQLGRLLTQTRAVVQRQAAADKMTFLPRADGRAVAMPDRAAALAASVLCSLWADPA